MTKIHDPENALTPPEVDARVTGAGYRYLAMDSCGTWAISESRPVAGLLCWTCEGLSGFVRVRRGGYPLGYFPPEIWQKILIDLKPHIDYCHVCENQGQTLNACVICGREATSPLAVMLDKRLHDE